MIKRIDLENFMGVQANGYEFKENASIISGRNGIGKSTLLNALNWILTDSLYTDKPGTGEKDIDSIVPKDHAKGEHTSVTIMFDNGRSYTKTYKVGFDRETGKANKHTTEVAINGIKVRTIDEFYTELYEDLKFKPAFKALRTDEPRLFTDPLFALLKLDYKDLRELLVSMGCTVDDEELFNNGFADVKEYQIISGGNWARFRTSVKDNIKKLKKQEADNEAQVKLFNGLPEFNANEYAGIEENRTSLIIQQSQLREGNNNEQANALKLKKQELEHTLAIKKQDAINQINANIKDLEGQLVQYQKDLAQAKENASKELFYKKDSLQAQLRSKQSEISMLNNSLNSLKTDNQKDKDAGNNAWDAKTRALKDIASIEQEQFQGYVTCPHCGETFAANPDDLARFEKSKQDRIDRCRAEIQKQTKIVEDLQNKIPLNESKINELATKIQYANDELGKLKHDIASIESNLAEIKPEDLIPNPTSVINNKLILERSSLEVVDNRFLNEQEEIDRVQLQIDILSKGDVEAQEQINKEIAEYQEHIDLVSKKLEELSVIKKDNERKASLIEQGERISKDINDEEFKLERINEFIRTKIKLINDKAKEKTGFEFVMLEENLSGGLNEVCYPLIDGIPFMKINNSAKLYWGIKFIEVCKKIAVQDFGVPHNQFPILADDLEKVDDINKLKTLTTEQLICTRVSTSEEIEIL